MRGTFLGTTGKDVRLLFWEAWRKLEADVVYLALESGREIEVTKRCKKSPG